MILSYWNFRYELRSLVKTLPALFVHREIDRGLWKESSKMQVNRKGAGLTVEEFRKFS